MAAGMRILPTVLLLCASQIALAESLPDPTLPAIDLNGGSIESVQIETAPRGLQSTIISSGYRAAIINGETVILGGKYGDSKLVEVRENSVVLQNSQGRRVMELFPKVIIRKNAAKLQESSEPNNMDGQTSLPEKDAGGLK
jgi:MSHA biogenesis protein MshK